MTENQRPSASRRRLLVGVGTGLSLAAAGCMGDESASITPVSLDGERACDECGMIIEDHPGPVGQIHFEDDEPEGGRPGQFCSSTCTYTYRFDAEDAGRTPLATFLTDYSAVDYEVFEEGSDTMFSSHVESETFARTTELTVVARSEIVGAMGPELIPFSEEGDVESFVEEYGGEPMPAEDVERSTLEAL
ncbi:nitrous oxide reductase accessory protein NosL [Halorubrum kocurii]|uniref:NosL family protein n=1 Tax=Halorubrum kocurii JCM 14978 TaxID=1230456 RepID=M0P4R3_9EURY|nr:nitrous oxide reductase accessory protein NosL [Halorubrum kocurii]EMA64813.1 NosL family protein [Halorubrum kocurii JCM 14978]